MLLALLCLAALAPGVATGWLLRRRGTLVAVLAGAAVTVSLPFLLALSLVVVPPLGILVAALAGLAALNAYEKGHLWVATAWGSVVVVACACSGWQL